jgi:DNA polymerase-3 subunit epsilon
MKSPLAIVDLETTGTSPLYGRIIEVGILRVEEGNVVRSFESLVNPGRYVHPSIEELTGISNDDLARAPSFEDVAREIRELLDGAVFVAHNARFDYSFLRTEYRRLGQTFSARCLCSMKLSRKIHSEFKRHDLNSVIERNGLSCNRRHRAMGDARAVYDFLRVLDATVDPDRLARAESEILKSGSLPTGVDRAMIDALPDSAGVYLMYGRDGELLYVGKSRNIRERVLSHFSGDQRSGKEMEICQKVHTVEARRTSGELGALLLESQLIKDLRPMYNTMSRRIRKIIAASMTRTRKGYSSVVLEEIDSVDPSRDAPVMGIFRSMKQAKEFLLKAAKTYDLCYTLLGLERRRGYCFAYQLKHCHGACMGEEPPEQYNPRVEQAFAQRRIRGWPFPGGVIIEERDGNPDEGDVFLVDQWCLVSGFRYTAHGYERFVRGNLRFDYDSYKILFRYMMNRANRRNVRVVPRSEFGKFRDDTLYSA